MTRAPRRLLPALCVLPLLFAACGGGGSSDSDDIKDIIIEGAKTPATICDNASKALLEQLGGAEGCKSQAPKTGSTAPESDAIDVTVDGDKATAKFTDDDGDNTVSFVKEDGDWKVSASETAS